MATEPAPSRPTWLTWTGVAVAGIGLIVVAWACVTEWGGIIHGHPAYAVLLGLTAIGCGLVIWLALRPHPRSRRRGWHLVLRIVLIVLAAGWIALMAWLRPHTAIEPALAAMQTDAAVTVSETATEIVLTPSAAMSDTGVLFQPGALVDARAYAAILRPVVEEGHTVVIPKQPLGIAFLAVGALDAARSQHPEIDGWVVGGHSLGGTVAAIEADAADDNAGAPAVGLLLYASYPAADMSTTLTIPVLSISGTQDGLATPLKIEASRTTLPIDAGFTVVEGASHAQFGDYGPQAGDGTPEISDDDARTQISGASTTFVSSLGG